MMKFTKVHDDGDTIEVVTHAVSLPEIFVQFEQFLRGCGFSFDGEIDIVEDESCLTTSEE